MTRRPLPGRRQQAQAAPARKILIVTEGEKTEPHYFDELKRLLKLAAADVDVVHPPCTDPENLATHAQQLKAAAAKRSKSDLGVPYEEVWVVFDLEGPNHPYRASAKRVLSGPLREGLRFAQSDPSFEFWLLLHFRYTDKPLTDSADAEKELKRKDWPTYQKAGWPQLVMTCPQIALAVFNARKLRASNQQTGSTNPATDVDQLVSCLNDVAQAPHRIEQLFVGRSR